MIKEICMKTHEGIEKNDTVWIIKYHIETMFDMYFYQMLKDYIKYSQDINDYSKYKNTFNTFNTKRDLYDTAIDIFTKYRIYDMMIINIVIIYFHTCISYFND